MYIYIYICIYTCIHIHIYIEREIHIYMYAVCEYCSGHRLHGTKQTAVLVGLILYDVLLSYAIV